MSDEKRLQEEKEIQDKDLDTVSGGRGVDPDVHARGVSPETGGRGVNPDVMREREGA